MFSSNLLVDMTIHSSLDMRVFAEISKEALPKRRIWVNIELSVFVKELSIFLIVLKWLHLWLLNKRQLKKNLYLFQYQSHTNNMDSEYTFFYEQSIFDPCSEYCLSFSKKPPQKIVYQLFSRWSINFYCLNIQTF